MRAVLPWVIAALVALPAAAAERRSPPPETAAPLYAADPALMIGKPVSDSTGTVVGRVADVLMSVGGRPSRVVIGLGARRQRVAVDASRLEFAEDGTLRLASLTQLDLLALPPAQPAANEVPLDRPRKR